MKRVVISIHGIRTFGEWQDRFERLLRRHVDSQELTVISYRYGYFSLIAFLIPVFRWLVVRRFRVFLKTIIARQNQWDRVDIVGHSFGTYILAWAIYGLSEEQRGPIHTIILAGSVLKRNFPWRSIRGVSRVINDCGTRDNELLLSQIFALGTGMAGRLGFNGGIDRSFRNRYFHIGHSGYFRYLRINYDGFMEKYWIPLLVTDQDAEPVDPRKSSPLNGVSMTLLNNAEPIKLLVYIAPFAILALVMYALYARAERELSFANSLQPVASAELEEIANSISRDKVGDSLKPFLPKLSEIMDKIPSIIGDISQSANKEDARIRRRLFLAIGRAFHNYGSELRDRRAFETAKNAYEAVLRFENPERDVGGWTSAKLNLGDILRDLGGSDSSQQGEADLRNAVRTYNDILNVLGNNWCDRSIPLNLWNYLGAAYIHLGLRGSSPGMDRAMLSLKEALKCEPDGGMVHYHIGVAKEYFDAHDITSPNDPEPDKGAEAEFNEALKDYPPEKDKIWWAMVLTDLGETLQIHGHHEDAIKTFQAAREVYKRQALRAEWARIETDIGISNEHLGENCNDKAARNAVDALTNAELVYTRDQTPVQWARMLYFRCAARLTLGEHGDKDSLSKAVVDCGNAFEEASLNHSPVYWGTEHYDTSSFVEDARRRLDRARILWKKYDVAARTPAPHC
jgi:tetratricopeptide (TPR) repeat protein